MVEAFTFAVANDIYAGSYMNEIILSNRDKVASRNPKGAPANVSSVEQNLPDGDPSNQIPNSFDIHEIPELDEPSQ